MSGLAWKVRRLGAMSVPEIVHRGSRWVGQRIEQVLLDIGDWPTPDIDVGPQLSLFPDCPGWEQEWSSRFLLDRGGLERLLRGKVAFFGHAPLDVGSPVDWHRDPLTGVRAPLTFGKRLDYRDERLVGNVKFLWELGRHQHLIPLAVAYAVTGEARYRAAIVKQIEGWIGDNPYAKGIHWCSALEVALRLIAWAFAHSLLALRDGQRGLFDAGTDEEALGIAIYRQAWFVRHYLSRYSSANNHLIGELTGLWIACKVFGLGTTGEKWSRFAHEELEREARRQVHPDGVDKEQAFYYHLWVLEYLLVAWLTGERSGHAFSGDFRDRILAMSRFLADVSPPGGCPPQVGDSDDGFVVRFEFDQPQDPFGDVREAVAGALIDKASGQGGLAHCQKAYWYGLMVGQLPADPPGDLRIPVARVYPVAYPDGGYWILGDDSVHAVFDAGALGYPSIAAHGHADALSMTLSVNGREFLVDPGTYAYHDRKRWRDYFRGTGAHNTVQVDGLDQSVSGGAFLWTRHAKVRVHDWRTDAREDRIVASHDGYERLADPVIHRREIAFDKSVGRFTVVDVLECEGEHEIERRWHLVEHCVVDERANEVLVANGTACIVLRECSKLPVVYSILLGSDDPPGGWVSRRFGEKVAAPTLVWRSHIRGTTTFVTEIDCHH